MIRSGAVAIIKASVRPAQGDVLRNDARFRILVAGRRFGKTQLALIELFRAVCAKDRVAWYVAPTYRQAQRIAWKRLKQLVAPWHPLRVNETDLRVDFPWGSTIALRGADNYDLLRGEGLDFVVLDEYASMRPAVWTEVIRPSLADRLGRALFIGTPKGHNHFYQLYEGSREQADWAQFRYTTEEGGNVPREELEAAARELDERTYRQEFQASFENIGTGRVYYAFDRQSHVEPLGYQRGKALYWSLDFNVNPMCSVLAQVEDQSTRADLLSGQRRVRMNVIGEIILPNSNTPEACEEFVRRARAFAGGSSPVMVGVYGDPAGNQRSTVGKTDWTLVREYLGRAWDLRVSYCVRSAAPAVKDRVNAVNAMLQSATGEKRLSIDPGCKELIADLEQVVWKTDASGNMTGQLDKSNPVRTHASDALGYLIEHEFGLHGATGLRREFLV